MSIIFQVATNKKGGECHEETFFDRFTGYRVGDIRESPNTNQDLARLRIDLHVHELYKFWQLE